MASHLASLWKRDFLELGNGLFDCNSVFDQKIKLQWIKTVMQTAGRNFLTTYARPGLALRQFLLSVIPNPK